MEQRRGDQDRRDRRRRGRIDGYPRAARGGERLHLAGEDHVEQVLGDAAPVSELGALREARGAGGVEDAGVGVGIDIDLRQVPPVRGDLADHVPPIRPAALPARTATRDRVPQHLRVLGDARDTLGVGEHDLGLGVVEAVGHLGGGPPGVHADHGDTDADAGPVDQHPFRIVAHGDGDAVARLHADADHPVGGGRHQLVRLSVSEPFVAVDQVVAVGESGGGEPQRADVRRGVLEGLQLSAAHLDLADLEGGARRREVRPGLVEFRVVHSCPRLCSRHIAPDCVSGRLARPCTSHRRSRGGERKPMWEISPCYATATCAEAQAAAWALVSGWEPIRRLFSTISTTVRPRVRGGSA